MTIRIQGHCDGRVAEALHDCQRMSGRIGIDEKGCTRVPEVMEAKSGRHARALDSRTKVLIEAKGSVTRDAVRTAVGELFDYGRFVVAKTRTVLVPARPRADLITYLASVGVRVVFPDGDVWRLESGGG